MNENKIIGDRYEIINKLGRGGTGITYQAIDIKTGAIVALKELLFAQLEDWKTIELFEREAKILKQLSHPKIPKYLDYFQIDEADTRRFYLVQQLAPGKSFAALIEEGWQPDESTVKNITIQVLKILIYLQKQAPPIIHRDIKPQNIIYNLSNRSKFGEVFLVDFGAVQETYYNTVTASTIVGTYGYMAPEQFRGKAMLSTDLYGLGTTLIFLLTRQSPADLPQDRLKINFRPYTKTKISKRFYSWLEKLIQPNYKHRFVSAQEAQEALNTLNTWKIGERNKSFAGFFVFNYQKIIVSTLIFLWSLYLGLMIYGTLQYNWFLLICFGCYFIFLIGDFITYSSKSLAFWLLVLQTISLILFAVTNFYVKKFMEMNGSLDSSGNAVFLTHILIIIDFLIFKYPRASLLKDLYKYFLKLFK